MHRSMAQSDIRVDDIDGANRGEPKLQSYNSVTVGDTAEIQAKLELQKRLFPPVWRRAIKQDFLKTAKQ